MEKANLLKLAAIGAVLVLVLNMLLFALGKINGSVFWVIIIIGAVLAFKVLPKMKHN